MCAHLHVQSFLLCCVCSQVLELLREGGGEAFDTMCLLRSLGQVKTDVVDGKRPSVSTPQSVKPEDGSDIQEIKGEETLPSESYFRDFLFHFYYQIKLYLYGAFYTKRQRNALFY